MYQRLIHGKNGFIVESAEGGLGTVFGRYLQTLSILYCHFEQVSAYLMCHCRLDVMMYYVHLDIQYTSIINIKAKRFAPRSVMTLNAEQSS